MTNQEWIRGMTDRELAAFIALCERYKIDYCKPVFSADGADVECPHGDGDCMQCRVDWLHREHSGVRVLPDERGVTVWQRSENVIRMRRG